MDRVGGVGDQGEAQRLVDLVVEVPAPDVGLVSEEQVPAQCVQAFALVEPAADSPAEFLIGEVAAEVDGADEPAVFLQCSGEGVPPTAGVQLRDIYQRKGPDLLRR